MRATSEEDMQRLRRRVVEVISATALAHGCTSEVDWMEKIHPYYPPLVNDQWAANFMSTVAGELLGNENIVPDVEPTMAGEDFSFIARAVPSAFAFLGIRNETVGSVHGLHTAQYVMDEGMLKVGAALHTALALRFLEGGEHVIGSNGARDEL